MFKKQEIGVLILAPLIMGFVISFKQLQAYDLSTLFIFLKSAGLAFIIIALCIITSKLISYRFGCDAEFRLWALERYGFHEKHYLKKPIPAWLLAPLILVFLTIGYVKWLATFVFDASHTTRVAKGKEYSDLTEWELGLIAFYGLFANIALAIISKFAGWDAFASLNIWFVFFNLLPISDLNGSKILHGSIKLWIFSIVFTSIILILLGITNITTTLIAAAVFALTAIVAFFHFFER